MSESEVDEEANRETVPFTKPVDVLRGTNSWGGGHITQLIHSDEEPSSTQEGSGESGEDMNESNRDTMSRKSVLSAPSLPKEAPVRFNYASSRINKMRHQHHRDSVVEAYNDEEENSA